MGHALRMVLGCVLPLLLIFLLPLIGVSEGFTLGLAIVLMFACHLFMIGGHGHAHGAESHDEEGHKHESA